MTNRNKTEVYIYGSRYTVSGAESEEYIHKLALYVDKKMREFSEANSALSAGMISVLAAINISDDYFKALDKLKQLSKQQQIETELVEKEYQHKINELNSHIQKFNTEAVLKEEVRTAQAGELEVIKSEFEKKEKSLNKQIELLKVEAEYKDEAIANQLEELENEYTQNKEELKAQINKLKDENIAKEQAMAEILGKYEQLKSEYKQMEELYQEEYSKIENEYKKLKELSE